jgi:hypothetical protein
MKNNLFKKTISSLQTQIQEKTSHIIRLENETVGNKEHVQNDFKRELLLKENENNNLKSELENAKNDLKFIRATHDIIKEERDAFLSNHDLLLQKNNSFTINHQKMVNELDLKNIQIHNLQKQLEMERNIKENLETELHGLKIEISQHRTELRNVINLKDLEIKKLTESINKGIQQRDLQQRDLQERDLQERNEIGNERKINTEPIKGSVRGIRSTDSRGIRPSNR